jgi:hypothetical protein
MALSPDSLVVSSNTLSINQNIVETITLIEDPLIITEGLLTISRLSLPRVKKINGILI